MINKFQLKILALFLLLCVTLVGTWGTLTLIPVLILTIATLSIFMTTFIGSSWLPTPYHVVREVLKETNPKKGQIVYDLGAGDCRFVLEAAKKTKATVIGIEADPIKCLIGFFRIKMTNLGNAKIMRRNFFSADISNGNIAFCYLPEKTLAKLVPAFKKMKKGSRIVSYGAKISNLKLAKELKKEKLYIYTI